MANMVGKVLGKYQIVELLGKGGMAEVYKAWHPRLDRFVTIKILYSYLAEGEDFQARFAREAKAVASLKHPHIVQIHDFDSEDDIFYMVMEYLDGGNLQQKMLALSKKGRFMPYEEVLAVLQNVAEALDYAHRKGIIHRDIKPSNILLDTNGSSCLADFGIARMLSATPFTSTGSLIGTPAYMSPEQGQGSEVTASSDVYSLGVVLFELLTGKVPFTSDTTPLAIIHKHITEPPPLPRSLRPDLPEAAERVILKALAKDPRERYASAGELVRALEQALAPAVSIPESPAPESATVIAVPQPLLAETPSTPADATLQAAAPEKPQPAPPPAAAPRVKPKKVKKGRKSPLVPLMLVLLGLLIIGYEAVKFLPSILPGQPRGSTSTPVPPTPAPDLVSSTYDDFDNPEYEGEFNRDLWKRVDESPNSIVVQHNGMLMVDQPKGNNNTTMMARGFGSFSFKSPIYFETNVRLVSNVGAAILAINTSGFSVSCSISNQETGKGRVSCFNSTANSVSRIGSGNMDSAHDWHVLRMEIYPESKLFVCTLDGVLVYKGVPDNFPAYAQANFSLLIGVNEIGQATQDTIAYFDVVKIDLIR